jgi:O-antigen/teichoic acid export membrane protein
VTHDLTLEESSQSTAILANAGWLTFGRLAGDILGFLLFVVVSRTFGPEGTGLYAYGFAVSGFVYVVATLGLEDFGVREFARRAAGERHDLLDRLLTAQVVLLTVPVVALVAFLWLSHTSMETATIIVLFSLYQIGLALSRTLFVPAFANQAMAGPAVTELSCRLTGVVLSLCFILVFKWPLVAAIAAFPVAGLLLVVMASRSPRQHLGRGLSVSTRDLPAIVRAAWPFAMAELVFQFYARADVILVLWIVGEAAAGIYASAFKFVEVGLVPLFFLGLAAYPGLSRLAERDGDLTGAYEHLLRNSLFVAGVVSWGLIFVVPSVVGPILGGRFLSVGPLVRIMSILPVLMAVEIASSRVLLATHRPVQRVIRQAWATGINVVLNILLIPRFGSIAAAYTAIVGLLVADGLYLHATRNPRVIGATWACTGMFLIPVLTAIAAGVACVWLGGTEWMLAVATLAVYLVVSGIVGLIPDEATAWLRATGRAADA